MDYIVAIVVGAVACFGLMVAATEFMPDPPIRETISCACIPGCETMRFDMGEGRFAYCAIWALGNQSKCAVDRAK